MSKARRPRWGLAAAVLLCAVLTPAAHTPKAQDKSLPDKEVAQGLARTQLRRLGSGYVAKIDCRRRLIFITALDDKHFKQTAAVLAAFSDAYRSTLPGSRLPSYLTIVLPTAGDYKKLTPRASITGFYSPAERTLISVDRGRVLLHEFTHALHHGDMIAADQVHKIWVMEGLATLFEASQISPTGLCPRTDSRLLALQKAIRQKDAIPLKRLFGMSQAEFSRRAELCYAQARYVMLYLHQRGLLRRWYQTYRSTFAADPTGAEAFEKVLGKRTCLVEDDWKKWASKLELPWGELRSSQARLGLKMQRASKGVKVVGFVPGGAAERAGRIKVGDIIRSFNGRKVANCAELVGAIRAAGAMQTVTIELIRGGRPLTIRQPLGAAPTR